MRNFLLSLIVFCSGSVFGHIGQVDNGFTFDPGDGLDEMVRPLVQQPDGKVILGGDFTSFDGTSRNGISRLNTNGSLDVSFNPITVPGTSTYSLMLLGDGKIVVRGDHDHAGYILFKPIPPLACSIEGYRGNKILLPSATDTLFILTADMSTMPNSVSPSKISVENISTHVFRFNGKGSWFTPSNWENGLIPPVILKAGDHIINDGKRYCMLSIKSLFVVPEACTLEVKPGAQLYSSIGNNLVFNGGSFINRGTVKVLSGELNAVNIDTSLRNFETTLFSKSEIIKSDIFNSFDRQ